MKMETNIVYQEDCIEGMKKIPSNSIDLVLTDPPYGITACEWDKPIDLEKWWVEIKRIIKPNGAIIMTASQPFTTDLINSNREWFKYELIWDKVFGVSAINSKFRPMTSHENILVFYSKSPVFNKQLLDRTEKRPSNPKMRKSEIDKRGYILKDTEFVNSDKKNPVSVISINRFSKEINPLNRIHPTQKPVELFKWLIKSYSNENQLVLDCFGGSGTTAIACIETNRKYILFENNPQYFKIINDRIQSAKSQTQLSKESCPNGEFNMGLEVSPSATPKSSPTEMTSPNPNIICNFKNPLVSREQLNKQGVTYGR